MASSRAAPHASMTDALPADAADAADAVPAVFALLDDARAGSEARGRLHTDFAHERRCTDPAALDTFWEEVEADLRAGLFAVVLADYEWGVALHHTPRGQAGSAPFPRVPAVDGGRDTLRSARRAVSPLEAFPAPPVPALRVLLFRAMQRLRADECDAWLAAVAPTAPAGILDLRQDIDADHFSRAIERIHAALVAGDCYQINYTFHLAFQVFGSPVTLYRQLRGRQPVPFGALIRMPTGWVVSLSPELFVRHTRGTLRAQPMKGTAARGLPAGSDDAQRGIDLANDPKTRAENVMIVDLLRNDLGRLAPPGGVSVSALFTPEAWPTVWQLTSTIDAVVPAATAFPDILRALFPCGSITGAPKRAAIARIAALETTPRGLYTGAIGWIDAAPATPCPTNAPTRRCGDFCLSVAIRTLDIAPAGDDGLARGTAGVGAGIVLDSRADDEYAECLLKARFLTAADPGFALFETILVQAGRAPRRQRHVARLCAAARRLGFGTAAGPAVRLDAAFGAAAGAADAADADALRQAIDAVLDEALATLGASDAPGPHRLRLVLPKSGAPTWSSAPLSPLAPGPVRLLLAREHGFPDMPAHDPLLRFKTTHRATYDAAWQAAERAGAFDMVFVNTRGHLTEGGRSNLFVRLDGRWFTPPVADGLLPGVMRGIVLEEAQWRAEERSLTLRDLERAEAVMLTNGLRGALPAVLRRAPDSSSDASSDAAGAGAGESQNTCS